MESEKNMEQINKYDEIKKKLVNMTGLAAQRKKAGNYWFEVGSQKRYVRINSSKFRAVSLDAVNPCGHLLISERKEVGVKVLKSALFDAANPKFFNHKPGNPKPEHRVQASIIWQALTDPQGLPTVLGIADHVDALWFVTDELSLPPIRADIIMLGERGGCYFPVFVELKSGRTTDVGQQLTNASEIARKVSVEFRQFLGAATGKPSEDILMERPMLLVIWGHTTRERSEAQKMRANHGLLTVCHREQGKVGEDGYGVFKFSLSSGED
jgi:hypothetical protein